MSLYGDGRRDGLLAALAIVVISLGVRVMGHTVAIDGDLLAALRPAALPALGGVLCYRLLRALGCSRYAGFLVGAGYAVSPWSLALAARPHEQFAAAFAPLALEAAWRCGKPATRAAWLRRSWLCFATPWLAGPGLVAACATALAVGQMLRQAHQRDLDGQRLPAAALALPLALTALVVTALCAMPGNDAWPLLGDGSAPPIWLFAVPGSAARNLDATAAVRVPGAALLALAVLGLLRRQRRVAGSAWTALALVGALPTALGLGAMALAMAPHVFVGALTDDPWQVAAVCWLLLLGVAVLAGAGLDDVLDAPHRHAAARRWLLAGGIATVLLLPGLGPSVLAREWPLVAGLLAPPLLLPAWRRLGMPRLKSLLSAIVIGTLAVPSLHLAALPTRAQPLLAAPAGETRLLLDVSTPGSASAPVAPPPAQRLADSAAAALRWHYVAASLWLALGGLAVAMSMARRSRHASQPPAPANAAIAKNAPPAATS